MSAKLDEIKSYLSKSRCVVCGETLTLGNVVSTVFRADRAGEKLVVKIGIADRAAQEVRMNCAGYDALRQIGAGSLAPDPLEYVEFNGIPILIMEDCGLDFWHAARVSANPAALYGRLFREMEPVHAKTRRRGDGEAYLDSLRRRLLRQYEVHLRNLIPPELIFELADTDLRDLVPPVLCFASFDFTPEDVFLTDKGVRFADPPSEVIGIPIVDLACFAGVARDAYGLPGSDQGYKELETLALNVLPRILELNESPARKFFTFGRALQCALSARFRLESDPARAAALAGISRSFLQKFLQD